MGDHWLVSGSENLDQRRASGRLVLLPGAHRPSKKHEGISFLLIDMKSPGVEARPILLINGTTPFCETFFTDVKVPKENLMGPLNGGWTIAKRLLQHERQGISGAGQLTPGAQAGAVPGPPLDELARDYVGAGRGRPAGRRRPAHAADQAPDGGPGLPADRPCGRRPRRGRTRGPSAVSSVLKNVGSQVRQERAELAVEILGAPGPGLGRRGLQPRRARRRSRAWLRGKSGTIAGGSQEIQNNIISKRILGLPEVTQADRVSAITKPLIPAKAGIQAGRFADCASARISRTSA